MLSVVALRIGPRIRVDSIANLSNDRRDHRCDGHFAADDRVARERHLFDRRHCNLDSQVRGSGKTRQANRLAAVSRSYTNGARTLTWRSFELSILCGRSVNACWNALYHADRAWTCRFILGKSAVEVDDIDSTAYRDDIGPGVAHILAEARYHQKMSARFYDAAWHPWRRVSIDPPPFEPIITPLLYKELEELSSEANAIVSSIERMSTEEMEEALSKLDAIGKSVMDIQVGHAKSNSANSGPLSPGPVP